MSMLDASEKPTDLVIRSLGRSVCIEQCEGEINDIVQAKRLQSQGGMAYHSTVILSLRIVGILRLCVRVQHAKIRKPIISSNLFLGHFSWMLEPE